MVGDQVSHISALAAELKNIDAEIAENEMCLKLRKERVKILQDLVDRVRAELVLSANEVRRYRQGCNDCMRCADITNL
jgi:hypothetical protein